MKLPRSLLLMVVIEALAILGRTWFLLGEHEPEAYQTFFMVTSGLSFAAHALAIAASVTRVSYCLIPSRIRKKTPARH